MATKTQFRLQQLTGTLDDTRASAGSVDEASLQGVLDHMASAIQRIHGTTGFQASQSGQFDHATIGLTGSILQANSTYTIKTRANALTLDGTNGLNLAEGGTNIFTVSDARAVALANHTTLDMDGSGNVTIDSSGGTIGIGTDNVNQNINIGTGGAREVTIGAASGANAAGVTIRANTGGIDIDASQSTGAISLDTAGGAIEIGVNAAAGDINIGTNGTQRDITIGNATGDTLINIDAGTQGVDVDSTGKINIASSNANADAIILDASAAGGGVDIIAGNAANDANSDISMIASNKLTIDAQGTDANDGVEITLGADTADVKFIVQNDSGNDGLTVDGLRDVTVGRNLTVTGDLTVNGATVTVDVANLNVEDPFILLGDGAQVANSNAGIIFVSGSSAGSARPDVSFARVANDTWALGSIASNSGSITNATGATIDVNMRAKSFEIVDGNNVIKDTSNEMHLESDNKIRLDVGNTHVISLREAGTQKGIIDFNSNTLIMSSTLGALELMSATGGILFQDTHDGVNPRTLAQFSYGSQEQASILGFDAANSALVKSQGGQELALGFSGGGYLALGIEDTNNNFMGSSIMAFSGSTTSNDQVDAILLLGKDSSPSAGFTPNPAVLNKATLTISGSEMVLDNGEADQFQLRFKSNTANGNYVGLRAPGALAASYLLTLPADDGGPNDVLQTNGSGVLSWVPQGGAAAAIKKVGTITGGTKNANTAIAFSTGATFSETTSALDVSSVSASARLNAIDVYVNGQLLQSGTSAPAAAVAGGDYVLVDVNAGGGFVATEDDADLKFAFALENDDVVTVIVRA